MVGWQAFVVAHAAPAPADPGQGAFDDPAAGQDGEAAGVVGAFDDGDGQGERGQGPFDEQAGVAAVGPYEADVLAAVVQELQQWLGGVAVGDAGGGDQAGQ